MAEEKKKNAASEPKRTIKGVITGVHDGDTAYMRCEDGSNITIRFACIDAPEDSENTGYQAFGKEAGDFARNLINGKEVTVYDYGNDYYKRVIGRIMLEDGTDVNGEMVKAGYAMHNTEYDNTDLYDQYASYQEEAKSKKAGIWSDPEHPPQKPSDFRHNNDNQKQSQNSEQKTEEPTESSQNDDRQARVKNKRKGSTTGRLELDKRPVFVPYQYATKRKKTKKGFEENSDYLKRYYSSIDAEIYFGNEYVEEVCDINWQITQQTQPLFGYNSYTLDEFAQGARMVSGTFSIRFISPNYLFEILKAAETPSISHMDSYKLQTYSREDLLPQGKVDSSLQYDFAEDNHHCLWPQTFDIDVIFGQQSEAGDAVHIVLEGVKITQAAISPVTASPGESNPPITETYAFIAKDIKTIATPSGGPVTSKDLNRQKESKKTSAKEETLKNFKDTTGVEVDSNGKVVSVE